jgi:hypothetical protein
MRDDITQKDRWQQNPPSPGLSGILQSKEGDTEGVAACKAFGYLRGIRDHAAAVEFRFRNGNSTWFPYSWLGNWCFNPSEGLLVKFSGDLVYLVLIKGSNLDRPLKDGAVTLAHAGFQRHRLLWVREMTDEEIRHVGETEPTIDSIQVAGFESQAALRQWVNQNAALFMI